MKPSDLPAFPGWRPLAWDGELIDTGDRLVCIKPTDDWGQLHASPDTAFHITGTSSWYEMSPHQAYAFGLNSSYYPYRKLRVLPGNPHFAEPLPLP